MMDIFCMPFMYYKSYSSFGVILVSSKIYFPILSILILIGASRRGHNVPIDMIRFFFKFKDFLIICQNPYIIYNDMHLSSFLVAWS